MARLAFSGPVRAIRSAREFIYLESQYLWSPEIVQLLAAKLRTPPTDQFRVLLVLPGKPYGGAEQDLGRAGGVDHS